MHPALERLRTIPAILKIIFLILAITDLICTKLSSASDYPLVQFCWVMMIIAIIITTIFLFAYIFAFEKTTKLNWLEIELIFSGIASLTFMLISSLLIRVEDYGLLRAGASFGYLAMIIFAVDAYLKHKQAVSL